MSETPPRRTGRAAPKRTAKKSQKAVTEENEDQAGQPGNVAAKARAEQPTPASERAEQPASAQARQEAMEHAEELVNRMGQRIGEWTSVISLRLRQTLARAREEGEDILAEAQSMSRRQPK
jgi:hypothetical protein